jgi:hypothetical protein
MQESIVNIQGKDFQAIGAIELHNIRIKRINAYGQEYFPLTAHK